jgi:hypothetical protein
MRFFCALIALCLLPILPPAAVPARGDAALVCGLNAQTSTAEKDPRKSPGAPAAAELVLANENLRAIFASRGLASLLDVRTGQEVVFKDESFVLTVNGRRIDAAPFGLGELKIENDRLIFSVQAGEFTVRAVYELKPGWRFLTKQIFVEAGPASAFRVDEIRAMIATLGTAPLEELKLSEGRFGTIVRFADGAWKRPAFSLFVLFQNPFNAVSINGTEVAASYAPDMEWKADYGVFASDRLCLGLVPLSGVRVPAKAVPEWKYVADYNRYKTENALIDMAESDALVECVRSFLLYRPEKSIRVHVPWCENDYQIDVAAPEGWTEYKRIIDRAAELGCRYTLFTPANSRLSSLEENRDAWGWENLLFFALGQKIRKGDWIPSRDAVPADVQNMLNYGKSRGLKYLAYAYPSLPFLQNPEWTRWAGDKVGGYNAADTGVRSFQDWWLGTLVDFVKKTGAGGFSFDHWWIAYDKASSRYAQWYGCRRILEELRRRLPDIVMDGRQQYMNFGPWTWLAGSYPHPTTTDEQPESFTAFPDLHTDRVSADRQRFSAWKYRVERFAPPEIMPGFMTHQTERTDAAGIMRRDRFRVRDWDRLGWKYSVLSSLATAPFNHTVSFIPARDEEEFKALSEADKAWFRGWLDWTDAQAALLKRVKPIIGPPLIGRCDGTAAIDGDHGFIFLFNPNYRVLDAPFKLDASIGLSRGSRFVLNEVYPQAGALIGKPGAGFWGYGDEVSLSMGATSAVVLEVRPAPAAVTVPFLFGAPGRAVLNRGTLGLSEVTGEIGTERNLVVILPAEVKAANVIVNGYPAAFKQERTVVRLKVAFAGEAFVGGQAVAAYNPKFEGGTFQGRFNIPGRVFEQLRRRQETWPVDYTEDDLRATWLGSHRLLLFVQIAEPDEAMIVSLKIGGKTVVLQKAYNSIYGHEPKRTFLGFYADVTRLDAGREYELELELPKLAPGRFQGVFFENIEPEYTTEIRTESK